MPNDRFNKSLKERFAISEDNRSETFNVEHLFQNECGCYMWRGRAHRIAFDLCIPIKMRTNDGLTMIVSTQKSEDYFRIVDAMGENVPISTLRIGKIDNKGAESDTDKDTGEEYDYNNNFLDGLDRTIH